MPVTANGYVATGQTVQFTLGFEPAVGTDLTLVDNTGLDFIDGTFENLSHGQVVELTRGGQFFVYVADYFGGTGNDLVLVWKPRRAYAWGLGDLGRLGDGTGKDRTMPTAVDRAGILEGKTILRMAAGLRHSVALASDGTVAVWGGNNEFQLGTGNQVDAHVPRSVDLTPGSSALAGKRVVAVAAGAVHSLALCSDGSVAAWGNGLLGTGGDSTVLVPTAVSTEAGVSALHGRKVVAISAGLASSLALCSDGTVVQWGTLYDSATNMVWKYDQFPTAVSTVAGDSALHGKSAIGVSSGSGHMVRCTDGTAVAWGSNAYGELGDGTSIGRPEPVAVNRVDPQSALVGRWITALAAGKQFNYALCADGAVTAWGNNGTGALGLPPPPTLHPWPRLVDASSPASALTGREVIDIAAGETGGLALCRDGIMASWGGWPWHSVAPSVPQAIDFAPDIPGSKLVRVFSGAGASHGLAIAAAPPTPIIRLLGNGQRLENHESTPDAERHTDFGNLAIGQSRRHVFTIENPGDSDLQLTATPPVQLSGPGVADFKVTRQPDSMVPRLGGQVTFEVEFMPSASWLRAATVRIANNVAESTPFEFHIAGTGRGTLTATWAAPATVPLTVAQSLSLGGSSVSLNLAFTPEVGADLTLIDNTGPAFLQENFENLPDGQTVGLTHAGKRYEFVVNYFGGTGNDLVLVWKKQRLYVWGSNEYRQVDPSRRYTAEHTKQHPHPIPMATLGALDGQTVVSVVLGRTHCLALTADGRVWSWGDNSQGYLGDGTTNNPLTPVAVDTAPGSALHGMRVVKIAAAGALNLALCSDGSVARWGRVRGVQQYRPIPLDLAELGVPPRYRSWTGLELSVGEAMALCRDGSVLIWGTNFLTETPGTFDWSRPRHPGLVNLSADLPTGPRRRAVALAGLGTHLALCEDGTVVEWEGFGSLPIGYWEAAPTVVSRTEGQSSLFGRTPMAVGVARGSKFALSTDGVLSGWGTNYIRESAEAFSLLGDGSMIPAVPFPTLTNTTPGQSALAGKRVRAVSAGDRRVMALCDDGTVAVWGDNEFGKLGDGTSDDRSVPTPLSLEYLVPGDRLVRLPSAIGLACPVGFAVAASPARPEIELFGNGHSIAPGSITPLRSHHTDFGLQTTEVPPLERSFTIANAGDAPLTLSGISGIQIGGSAAADFSVVAPPAAVVEAGETTTFSIRFAATRPATRHAVVRVLSDDPRWPALEFAIQAASPVSLVAVFSSPADVAHRSEGFLADGSSVSVELRHLPEPGAPLVVVDNTGVGFIQGQFTNLAHGEVVALRFGNRAFRYVADYFGGTGNDLVLQWENNRVVSWTYSGGANDPSTPVARFQALPINSVGVLAGRCVTHVVSGQGHTLALCADGGAAAWGDGYDGQLGNGSSAHSLVPVAVEAQDPRSALFGKTVVALAAGEVHSLALCSDGTVAAWGANNFGQLGDGTRERRLFPVAVSTQSGVSALAGKTVVQIAARGYHSLARCSDGTVVRWGGNIAGDGLAGAWVPSFLVPVLLDAEDPDSALRGRHILSVAAGHRHALALCADGAVVSWGRAKDFPTLPTANAPTYPPRRVDATEGVSALAGRQPIALSAGGDFSLALCADGAMVGWGGNENGQLGIGNTADAAFPVLVGDQPGGLVLERASTGHLVAGERHSVVFGAGRMQGWGEARQFPSDLRNTAISRYVSPVDAMPPLPEGSRFVRPDESARMIGSFVAVAGLPVAPAIEVLGNGQLISHDAATSPLNHTEVGAVEVGGSVVRTFTIRNPGEDDVVLSGNPRVALIGPQSGDFRVSVVPAPVVARQGGSTTFEVAFTPTASWKRSATMVIASNDPDHPEFRIPIVGWGAVTVEARYATGTEIPLSVSGEIVLTGSRVSFVLDHQPAPGTELLVVRVDDLGWTRGEIEGLPAWSTVELPYAGFVHAFMVTYSGGDGNDVSLVWKKQRGLAWGDNGLGRLGIGVSDATAPAPTPLSLLGPAQTGDGVLLGKTVTALAAGMQHGLALTADGVVAAWGSNANGQLGSAEFSQRRSPGLVSTSQGSSALHGKHVVQIAAGGEHNLALSSDGALAAWGRNDGGQLGIGTLNRTTLPRAVITTNANSALMGRRVVAIAAGGAHSLALCADGTLASWGAERRLGDGSEARSALPVVVSRTLGASALAGKSVHSLAAGRDHSVALCADGTVVTWGLNSGGQLGDGTTTTRLFPVAVDASSPASALFGKSVLAVAAGSAHTLALCSDGTVVAWGSNGSGQLGDGTASDRLLPAAVSTATGVSALAGKSVKQIAAGANHSIALCTDGTLVSWGANASRQLATGTTVPSPVPVVSSFGGLMEGERIGRISAGPTADHSFIVAAASHLTPLEQWRLKWFGNHRNQGQAADGADPDFDTIVNFLELATGSNPTIPGMSPLRWAPSGVGVFPMDLEYTWSDAAASAGVSPNFEHGTDLQRWIPWTPIAQKISSDQGISRYQIRINASTLAPQIYYRLSVTHDLP